jgi:hypothetical protein
MKYLFLSLVFLTSLILTDCASSGSVKTNQQNKNHKKSFKTSLVRANFNYQLGGLASPVPILYQVRSVCKKTDCKKPNTVLSFSIEPGSNDIFLNRFNLTIHAGDKDYHWEKKEWRKIRNSPPVLGRFLSVHLTKSQLKHIAESKQVKGNLAGNSFNWSYKNRKPLRALLEKLK